MRGKWVHEDWREFMRGHKGTQGCTRGQNSYMKVHESTHEYTWEGIKLHDRKGHEKTFENTREHEDTRVHKGTRKFTEVLENRW